MGEIVVRGYTGGPFEQNSYLVSCANTGKGIMVDAGAAAGELLDDARELGVEILEIVLTHAHIDHIDGAAEARRRTPVPIRLHRDDEKLYGAAEIQGQWFGIPVETPPPLDGYLRDGDQVTFGECALEVRHTPGHAPGHVILVGDGVALAGDCVFAGSIGRTDLPGGDLQTLMHSIRTRIMVLPDETILYPGHGPETTVGHERATNPFLLPNFGGSAFA